jgi:hypothetical protein
MQNTGTVTAPQFPVARPGESKAMYKARVHAYSTYRTQVDGMVRIARSN